MTIERRLPTELQRTHDHWPLNPNCRQNYNGHMIIDHWTQTADRITTDTWPLNPDCWQSYNGHMTIEPKLPTELQRTHDHWTQTADRITTDTWPLDPNCRQSYNGHMTIGPRLPTELQRTHDHWTQTADRVTTDTWPLNPDCQQNYNGHMTIEPKLPTELQRTHDHWTQTADRITTDTWPLNADCRQSYNGHMTTERRLPTELQRTHDHWTQTADCRQNSPNFAPTFPWHFATTIMKQSRSAGCNAMPRIHHQKYYATITLVNISPAPNIKLIANIGVCHCLRRSNVLTLCFCTTHSASIARTNSHSSYALTFVFNPWEPLLLRVFKKKQKIIIIIIDLYSAVRS